MGGGWSSGDLRCERALEIAKEFARAFGFRANAAPVAFIRGAEHLADELFAWVRWPSRFLWPFCSGVALAEH